MKLFFDRNIARRLARMLDGYDTEHTIRHLDDDERFQPNSKDEFIIAALAKENPKPVFLTSDLNMLSKYPREREALADSGLTVVFFRKTFHNISIETQAVKIIKTWPKIIEVTQKCRAPMAFEVTTNGKIQEIGPTAKL